MNRFKKDPIFWWASGIFILSLVLYAITQFDPFLALMIFAYLLRPTLASLGVAKKYVDEREMSLNYRSSNIGFVAMMIACTFFSVKLRLENNDVAEIFFMVMVIGIVVKMLFNVLLTKNFRDIAPKIIISVGLLMALFGGMGSIRHGLFSVPVIMNSLPGLILIGIGVLSKYYPKIAASIIFLLAVSFVIKRLLVSIDWGNVGTILIITVPLFSAAVGLWIEPKQDTDELE